MSGKTLGYVGATALALVAMAGAGPAAAQQEYNIRGDEVSIYNLAGRAEIVRGGGSEVVVRVLLRGEDRGELDVEVRRVDGHEGLVVVYPDDQIVYPEMGRGSRTTVSTSSRKGFWHALSGDRVTISGSGRGLEAWADLEILVPPGKSVSVYIAAGQAQARGVEGDLTIDTGSGRVEAVDIRGSLSVDTGSGSVLVRDVEGDVLVDTGSGSVDIDNVDGESIDVDTGSGGVEGGSLTAESLRIDTGSGSIKITDVTAPDVYLDTGSGSVRVDLLRDIDSLEIDTGSGSVTVTLPSDAGAEVDIETGSGGIDLDFPVTIRRASRDHVVGRVGDGGGRIHIDTGSGSVRLVQRRGGPA